MFSKIEKFHHIIKQKLKGGIIDRRTEMTDNSDNRNEWIVTTEQDNSFNFDLQI